jgi:hypothetical protein
MPAVAKVLYRCVFFLSESTVYDSQARRFFVLIFLFLFYLCFFPHPSQKKYYFFCFGADLQNVLQILVYSAPTILCYPFEYGLCFSFSFATD